MGYNRSIGNKITGFKMSTTEFRKLLKSKFAHIEPGQTHQIGSYTARPKKSTWFFISDLDKIRQICNLLDYGTFVPRFRGPRLTRTSYVNGKRYHRRDDIMQYTCLKEDAEFFSIYFR